MRSGTEGQSEASLLTTVEREELLADGERGLRSANAGSRASAKQPQVTCWRKLCAAPGASADTATDVQRNDPGQSTLKMNGFNLRHSESLNMQDI